MEVAEYALRPHGLSDGSTARGAASLQALAAPIRVHPRLQEAVPSEPFQLDQARFVSDPVSFLVRLYHDVLVGPQGPRARTGALQEDLCLLYSLDMS